MISLKGSFLVRSQPLSFWRRLFIGLIGAFLSCLFAGAAAAASLCYTDQEEKAELALRFHSQLMVISLSCQYTDNNAPLLPAYSAFTRQHAKTIAQHEKTLMQFFTKTEKRSSKAARRKLDDLRTRLANETTQSALQQGLSVFCRDYAALPLNAGAWDAARLNAELDKMDAPQGSYPRCAAAN